MIEDSTLHDGLEEKDEQVMSEVHLGCPPSQLRPYVSRFTINHPSGVNIDRCRGLFVEVHEDLNKETGIPVDEDGDLVLVRRSDAISRSFTLTVCHAILSSIPAVGLQVWKAELLLADFCLHKMLISAEFDRTCVLELGAGTGIAGMLLSHLARTVFLTDHGDEILENCEKNVVANANVLRSHGSVYVRELDWFTSWPPKCNHSNPSQKKRFSWTSSEIEEVQMASVLLAADVIYCDHLTDAFFLTIQRLMSLGQKKILYMALEKRYNFTLNDLEVVANGYSHFRSFFHVKEDNNVDFVGPRDDSSPHFVGERVHLSSIPQYMKEYDRGTDLELWKITDSCLSSS